MLRLILMRHAKSDWNHPALSDHDRPLNKRGRNAAKALGGWLRGENYLPDQVLCSSAQRTGETLLGLNLDPKPEIHFTRTLYLAPAETMLQVLNTATGQCVLMLGHNPGICTMANMLVETPLDHDRFEDYPTGATLVCDFEEGNWADVRWQKAKPVDFVIPRSLTD